jgi:hypothetical protein
MRVLVINFVHAKSKMKDRKARMKVLKARRKDVRMMAIEIGTFHVSLQTERGIAVGDTNSCMPIQGG